jgi:hypothetical protein
MADPEQEEHREEQTPVVPPDRQAASVVGSPPHLGGLESQALTLELTGVTVGCRQGGPPSDPGDEKTDPDPEPYARQDE